MSDWVFLNNNRVAGLGGNASHGFNGVFQFTLERFPIWVVASDGDGWKHVSVSILKSDKPPPWGIMCRVKDLFWEPEDWVVQFHPAHSAYVNNVEGCLHLWQPVGKELPTPPQELVGIKKLGVLPKKKDWRGNI